MANSPGNITTTVELHLLLNLIGSVGLTNIAIGRDTWAIAVKRLGFKKCPEEKGIPLTSLYPGSRLMKCVGEEESLVSTALRFKLDPRHSSGSRFHHILSYHARMESYPVKST